MEKEERELVTTAAVRQVLSDYWQQYKKYGLTTVLAFISPALGSILVFFVPPLIIGQIVNRFSAGQALELSDFFTQILLFGGLWLAGEALWRIGLHYLSRLEAYGIRNLNNIAFSRLVYRDYEFYANNFVGSLTKKALHFARSFEAFSDTLIFNVITNLLPMIFAGIILWRYSPWITLSLIGWILIAVAVGVPIVRKRSKLVALRHQASSRLSGRLSDVLTNILAIKSFAREEGELKTFGNFAEDFSNKIKAANDFQNWRFDVAISPIYVLTNVCGLILAIYFAQVLNLQPGMVVVVFSYYVLVTRVFWDINRVYRNIESAIGEAAEFTQILLAPPTIQDIGSADDLVLEKGAISFEDVSFRYSDASAEERPFLDGFNFSVDAGQRVGLVGPSGGGKTTITKLLLRFVDLQPGSINIDGQDISKVSQVSLRNAIAYVPQEPLLFHRSLWENIAYGGDKADKEAVVRAAKLARADEFIEKLPKGYDTLVGERGVKLSGGQRQRIAIARAILKNAPILVLDEATSSLDSESEKYIQEGLSELMRGKTVIVIAHRLSTIKHLDRIVVIEDGRIVQDGKHEELLAKPGLYAALWEHQSGGFLGAN